MSRGAKRLEAMRRNPRADWRIEDVVALCSAFDIRCAKPPGGSHYGISDATQVEILTVPFARPIKPLYIRRLVEFVDAVRATRAENEGEDDAAL